jgi:hypothetical protein
MSVYQCSVGVWLDVRTQQILTSETASVVRVEFRGIVVVLKKPVNSRVNEVKGPHYNCELQTYDKDPERLLQLSFKHTICVRVVTLINVVHSYPKNISSVLPSLWLIVPPVPPKCTRFQRPSAAALQRHKSRSVPLFVDVRRFVLPRTVRLGLVNRHLAFGDSSIWLVGAYRLIKTLRRSEVWDSLFFLV